MAASRNNPDPLSPPEIVKQLALRFSERLFPLFQDPVSAENPLWVGLSGGRDSVTLLHLAKNLLPAGSLRALHVHHGLSPHADEWAKFCSKLCQEWGIPLETLHVAVPAPYQQGLEAAARKARYQAYQECAQKNGARYLALAHHARDQAETLLFHLCRGAGVHGAAAMPPTRKEGMLTLLRPLLTCGAKTIAAYAAFYQLQWVEDESNQDERYSRNFLRRQILPRLEERFPGVEANMARTAKHFAEARELLMEIAKQDHGGIQDQAQTLLDLSPARQANWMRYRLMAQGWRFPETTALSEALRQLAFIHGKARFPEKNPDSQFEWRLAEGSVRLWRGRLYFVPHPVETCAQDILWDGQSPCGWSGGILRMQIINGFGLCQEKLKGKMLTLRKRQGGETLKTVPGKGGRPLKKILQESNIPPWQRKRLPLLYLEDTLLACPNVAVAADWQCTPETAGIFPVWEG